MPRCYTCKPRGKVKMHIISTINGYSFHHDMNHRPAIIMTPIKHIRTIEEIQDIPEMLKTIKEFCTFWNIDDYQVSYNCGGWQKNEHFHIKIRIYDKTANRMRGDHFRLIKSERERNPKGTFLIEK